MARKFHQLTYEARYVVVVVLVVISWRLILETSNIACLVGCCCCCCCCLLFLNRLLHLAFATNLGLLCMQQPGMGPLVRITSLPKDIIQRAVPYVYRESGILSVMVSSKRPYLLHTIRRLYDANFTGKLVVKCSTIVFSC